MKRLLTNHLSELAPRMQASPPSGIENASVRMQRGQASPNPLKRRDGLTEELQICSPLPELMHRGRGKGLKTPFLILYRGSALRAKFVLLDLKR